MPDVVLRQAEADALLAVEKSAEPGSLAMFPSPGEKAEVALQSADGRESFVLDVSRARIKLTKIKFQNRARQVVVLARVDLNGNPHRNPDGVEIPCPHLHVYREGYGDKWALPLPETFTEPDNLWRTLEDFCRYCNITGPPPLERGLNL